MSNDHTVLMPRAFRLVQPQGFAGPSSRPYRAARRRCLNRGFLVIALIVGRDIDDQDRAERGLWRTNQLRRDQRTFENGPGLSLSCVSVPDSGDRKRPLPRQSAIGK